MNANDVEHILAMVADQRARGAAGELLGVADELADGMRRDFDEMDMEQAGTALIVAATSLAPYADVSPPSLMKTLVIAGENLVRTARARAAETREVWRSVDVDGYLPIEDAAENEIVEAFAEGDRVLWHTRADHYESATVESMELVIKLDDDGQSVRVAPSVLRHPAGDLVSEIVEEHVLTWHPVDGSEPTEIPFGVHVACPEQVGEFRLTAREVPSSAVHVPEVSGG